MKDLSDGADDDVLGVVGDGDPLLPCDTVNAVCKSLTLAHWSIYYKTSWVFNFTVYEPEEFSGMKLRMFVRIDRRWKQLPRASKLYKAACVAVGRRLDRGHRITKSMFVGRAFKCTLKTVDKDITSYSIVEMISEALTGAAK